VGVGVVTPGHESYQMSSALVSKPWRGDSITRANKHTIPQTPVMQGCYDICWVR